MSDVHHPSSRAIRLTGRAAGLVLLVLAIAYGIGGAAIEYAFASDPLGPRVVPIGLAVLLGLFCLFYLYSPGSAEGFPAGSLLLRVLAIPALLIVAALLFEPGGFAVSVFVLTFGTALLFGAPLVKSAIGAAGHAGLWWFVFAYLLDVYLPAGALFGAH
ncbi:tripartite tricarboxylate transporter TctB family protein [Allorhizobium sp. BGMRC 0089]|uniref:tripartite tricarboxylate transporter TctB family protein n=1 Tax=Allorhizobium sonneratiae TaxID=2934936 RepID=UPI002033F43B|nr:tripartite tricarboxylate transporter TctB family protein [Allorhizobium sonneratiae]MCM2293896.1 tripartite tricarboxylate transporter TctB family protein [Allorhizobium sonneratiae]